MVSDIHWINLHCVAVVNDLPKLDVRVSQIISSAWSTNNLSCRNSQWRKYLTFCADRGLRALPADLTTIVRFLAFLEWLKFKYVTINNYLSSIVLLHKFYGLDIQIRDSYLIQTVMAGLKKRLGCTSSPRLPLSVLQLQQIFMIYPRNPLNDCCWLAVVICFRTLLRKSNVLVDDNTTHVLLRKDVTFESDRVIFRVHTTKNSEIGGRCLDHSCSKDGQFLFLRIHIAVASLKLIPSSFRCSTIDEVGKWCD